MGKAIGRKKQALFPEVPKWDDGGWEKLLRGKRGKRRWGVLVEAQEGLTITKESGRHSRNAEPGWQKKGVEVKGRKVVILRHSLQEKKGGSKGREENAGGAREQERQKKDRGNINNSPSGLRRIWAKKRRTSGIESF